MHHYRLSAIRAPLMPALRLIITLACFFNLFLSPNTAALAAGGDLIPTFGDSGWVTSNLTAYAEAGVKVIVLADGKILAGQSAVSSDYNAGAFIFARYDANGALDMTFGTDGFTQVSFGTGYPALMDMAVDGDGKIVGAGMFSAPGGAARHFAIVRLCPDGALDQGGNCPDLQPKFGLNGTVLTQAQLDGPQNQSYAQAVAVQADNKIVAGGLTGGTGTPHKFALVRYNTDGSLDTTFDSDGIVSTTLSPDQDEINDLLVDCNQKIVAAGFTSNFTSGIQSFALARYNENGSLDGSFGAGGIVKTEIESTSSAYSIVEQSDGKLVAAGYTVTDDENWYQGFAVTRYNPDGGLDPSFGTNGIVIDYFDPIVQSDLASTVTLDAKGRILVGGTTYADLTYAKTVMGLARLCPDGSLDTGGCGSGGFGTGRIVLDPGTADLSIRSIAITSDDDYLAAGRVSNGGQNEFLMALIDSGDINSFTISGNAGIPGATLAYFDGTDQTVTADASGDYSLTVPADWSGAVTPQKTGYSFSPTSLTYNHISANQPDKDYAAQAITYTITGNVGVAGATLTFIDGTEKTATADASGDYSLSVSYNWSGALTPGKTGYRFTPAQRSYNNVTASLAGEDYAAEPIIYTITGNTTFAGVTLTYTDGTEKTVVSDSSGDYTLTVSYDWSGTITPTKPGFAFSPDSRTYQHVLSHQPGQDYTAAAITYTVSGNAGVAGVSLTYVDGTEKTVTSAAGGDYSFSVSYDWSGTVTPAKTGFTFDPANRNYTHITSNQTAQNYAAEAITYTISGNAGTAGASLTYVDGTEKTITADASGDYSLNVSYNWSGTITPAKPGFAFNPVSRTYNNVRSSQSNQDYWTDVITYTISGSVGIPGVTLTYTDGTEKTAVSDSSGSYILTVSYDWSGTVTPTRPGYTFYPTLQTYADLTANSINQDYGWSYNPPNLLPVSQVSALNFTLNWSACPGADGYTLDIARDPLFIDLLSGYTDRTVGNGTSFVVSGLSPHTTYFFRLHAHSGDVTSMFSLTGEATTAYGLFLPIIRQGP